MLASRGIVALSLTSTEIEAFNAEHCEFMKTLPKNFVINLVLRHIRLNFV